MTDKIAPLSVEVSETIDSSQPGGQRAIATETLFRIGRFIVVDRLGEGGMGQVFSAYDPDLDRKVAIKLVRGRTGDSPHAIARIRQEAQAMAKVSHPNVVQVYEVGESQGRIFIVMEIVDGGSLAQRQFATAPAGPQDVERRLRLYLQAALGLLSAHRCGLIHRDFKPDNVLLGKDGRVRVADFGLARMLAGMDVTDGPKTPASGPSSPGSSGPRLTQVGTVLGTAGYMSPEQVHGAEADERSDQFSFCAALYEALYGQQPFPGQSLEDYAASIFADRLLAPPPSHVPLVVQQAILRGLAIDPALRFPSMQELIVALEAGLTPDSEPLITRSDRLRIGLTLASIVILIMVTNLAVMAVTGSKNNLLRGMGSSGTPIFVACALLRWPPVRIRHPRRYRSMMGFFIFILGTISVWRLSGLLLRLPVDAYYTLEVIGLASFFGMEGLRVGWRHSLLALPALFYAPFVRLLPDLRITLYSLLLVGLFAASTVLHMRQAVPASSEPPSS